MRKVLLLIIFFTFAPCVLLAAIVNLSYYSFQKHSSNSFISLNTQAHASALPISYAALPTSDSQMVGSIAIQDGRILKLQTFFHIYGSILENYASTIVEAADANGLDYRLLPAIAMQESIGCKREIVTTHNCWGWGITSKQTTHFDSYEQAIDTVSRGLAKNYINKGRTTTAQIGFVYNPANTSDWVGKVDYFINQISITF